MSRFWISSAKFVVLAALLTGCGPVSTPPATTAPRSTAPKDKGGQTTEKEKAKEPEKDPKADKHVPG